ncbi:MAG: glycosyltransferase family 2 protein [Candidatus Daviesbacteria bacterium]|nr:glycosyltransferase family 2 protein [Candidatus Daviesbacteria bacterium]
MKLRKRINLPKISIVIPSFNKASYMEATLCSIVDQNYPNLEVIIQDGGSGDGTVEIIKKYANKYPGIFAWESKKDKGQVDAINKGLNKATGEILNFINADDIYKKDALIEIGRYFKDNSDALWMTGYGDITDKDGKVILRLITIYKNFLLNLNKYSLLLIVNFITQPSTFLSRKAYRQFGPFTGTRDYVMEYDLWLKLGKIQMPKVFQKTLSSFRLTNDNISSTSAKELLKIDNKITTKYTSNGLLLALHKLHNLGRIFLLNFMQS